MSDYRRAHLRGGVFFFTVVTYRRRPFLCHDWARTALRHAFRRVRQSAKWTFDIDPAVLLPDHLHTIWRLPADDSDFSTRWRMIKALFSRVVRNRPEFAMIEIPQARVRQAELAVWQRRFWEHVIRDDEDYAHHMDYIHYNPVKHGHVQCPHAWPYSSFHRWARIGRYPTHWVCRCNDRRVDVPPGLESKASEEPAE